MNSKDINVGDNSTPVKVCVVVKKLRWVMTVMKAVKACDDGDVVLCGDRHQAPWQELQPCGAEA